MNKKIVVITSLSVILIALIIGIMCYINSPKYIVNQYIKAYNEKDYNKMELMEYDYKYYEIDRYSFIDDYSVKHIEFIGKGGEPDYIDNNTSELFYDIMPTNNEVKYVYVYRITDESFPYLQVGLFNQNIIVVGKVLNEWKIVSSPFYTLRKY